MLYNPRTQDAGNWIAEIDTKNEEDISHHLDRANFLWVWLEIRSVERIHHLGMRGRNLLRPNKAQHHSFLYQLWSQFHIKLLSHHSHIGRAGCKSKLWHWATSLPASSWVWGAFKIKHLISYKRVFFSFRNLTTASSPCFMNISFLLFPRCKDWATINCLWHQ